MCFVVHFQATFKFVLKKNVRYNGRYIYQGSFNNTENSSDFFHETYLNILCAVLVIHFHHSLYIGICLSCPGEAVSLLMNDA